MQDKEINYEELELPTIGRGIAGPLVVASEAVPDEDALAAEFEVAPATSPVEMLTKVPDGYVPGQLLSVWGPHGPIEFCLPDGVSTGTAIKCRLSPPAEFKVVVPDGAEPGSNIRVRKFNGEEVCVSIPNGLQPGDSFEVVPPSLMVRVPSGVHPGDLVIFRSGDEWRKVEIPVGAFTGCYFAAAISS